MVSSRFVLAFFLIIMPIYVIHALNDMPLLAQLQGEHNASAFGYSMVSLDFNHDGYDDLVVYSMAYGYQYQQSPSRGKVYIYFGGPGFSSASEPAITLEGDYPEGEQRTIGSIINPGDINGDGFDDFMGYSDSRGMNVWLGTDTGLTPDPSVSLNPRYFGNAQLRGLDHGDFNGDGFSDVIGAAYQVHRFAVWLGSENMDGIADWQKVNTLENYGYDVAVGDFNGDGYDDIAVSAPFEEGTWPYDDYRGYLFIYGGNPGMVANDDPIAPQIIDQLHMRLSPNPVRTNGEITISISGVDINREMPLQVEIYNLKGQVLDRIEVNSISSIELVTTANLSKHPSGVYLCRARIGNLSNSKKFTIIK